MRGARGADWRLLVAVVGMEAGREPRFRGSDTERGAHDGRSGAVPVSGEVEEGERKTVVGKRAPPSSREEEEEGIRDESRVETFGVGKRCCSWKGGGKAREVAPSAAASSSPWLEGVEAPSPSKDGLVAHSAS